MNAETIRRGMAYGFRPAVHAQVGSLLGDVGWAALALAGLALVLRDSTLRAALGASGGLVLLWFAVGALRSAWRAEPAGHLPRRAGAGGLTAGGIADQTVPGALALVGSFAAGVLTWVVGVSALLAFGRRRARPAVFRLVDLAVGLAFGWLGVTLLGEAVRVLRG